MTSMAPPCAFCRTMTSMVSRLSALARKCPGRARAFLFAVLRDVLASADQRPQRRIVFNYLPPLDQTIEAEYMPGTFDHQIDEHAGINDMIVNQVIVDVLDVWEVHMRRP